MPLGGPGPRDWSPGEDTSRQTPARRGPTLWDPTALVAAAPRPVGRTRTRSWSGAVLALVSARCAS